jgi:hypothetical protein
MAFTFKLEHPDGTPADPPSAAPSRTGRSATRSPSGLTSRPCSSSGSGTRATRSQRAPRGRVRVNESGGKARRR